MLAVKRKMFGFSNRMYNETIHIICYPYSFWFESYSITTLFRVYKSIVMSKNTFHFESFL